MEYTKLDARLCEALDDPADDRAVYEVFIELDKDAGAEDLQRLARLGIPAPDHHRTVLTARVTRATLSTVSAVGAVRQVSLVRRLRPAPD